MLRELVPLAHALPPQKPIGIVPRDRLDSLGSDLLRKPLTLVTAPGGYGKTTLLLAWLDAVSEQARTAWLTLTPGDAALSACVEGITLACSRALADFGGPVRSLLALREASPAAYAAAIANELFLFTEERDEHVVLFIDDAHALASDADSTRFVSALLTALPERVHVVLAARGAVSFAPIAKYRNAGRLLEIDADDLRFRVEEAKALVQEPQAAQRIVERTEGWAIAIHLTARLARQRALPPDDVAPQAGEAVFAFLAEEVLSSLEPGVRELLGPLSIPETLDESVVAQILERDDPAAIIESLAAQSLYITRTSDGSWRFNHLFRDFLLKRLRIEHPALEVEARRRYASLLRERGDNVGALEQLIDAGDLAEIVAYVRDAVLTMRFTDRYRRLLDLLSQVPAEVKERKPVLHRFHAIALQRAGRWDEADKALRACYAAARAAGDDGVACIALLERGVSAGTFRFRMHGRHDESAACFTEALALAEGPALRGRPIYRKLAYEVLGLVHALRFEYDEAFRLLAQAEELEMDERSHSELLFVEIARVHMWLGDFRRALEYAELAETFFRTDSPFHVGYALIVQAKALVALHEDCERAVEICREAIESLKASYEDEELGAAYEALAAALLALDQPDLGAVLEACDRAEQFLDPRNGVVRTKVSLLRARVFAMMGDGAAVQAALARAKHLCLGDRWLEARVALEQATHGSGSFETCAATFERLGDRYHACIARLGAAEAHVRRGDFSTDDAGDLLDYISGSVAPYAVSHHAQTARAVLHWCMENGVRLQAAADLYDRVRLIADPQLAAIARNADAPFEGRVAALTAAFKHGGIEMRPLLCELTQQPGTPIGVVASTLLAQLPPESVPPLRIEVIGNVRVAFGAEELTEGDPRWSKRKAAELLRLLAVSGAPLTKNAVLQALWPDAYQGREVTLRVVIHALRRALQPAGEEQADYISYDGSVLSLRRSSIDSIDCEDALAALQAGKHRASIGDAVGAESLLLRAVEQLERVPKEFSTPLWMHPHLQRWRAAALDGLQTLASMYLTQKRIADAWGAIRRALALDVLDEATVTLGLECCVEASWFDEGQALYTTYKRRLADTLGTAPGPYVLEAYARLVSQRGQRKQTMLSTRETEIVRLIAAGDANKDIARKLGLSVYTVTNHVRRVLRKLGVENRAAAAAYLQREEVLR